MGGGGGSSLVSLWWAHPLIVPMVTFSLALNWSMSSYSSTPIFVVAEGRERSPLVSLWWSRLPIVPMVTSSLALIWSISSYSSTPIFAEAEGEGGSSVNSWWACLLQTSISGLVAVGRVYVVRLMATGKEITGKVEYSHTTSVFWGKRQVCSSKC